MINDVEKCEEIIKTFDKLNTDPIFLETLSLKIYIRALYFENSGFRILNWAGPDIDVKEALESDFKEIGYNKNYDPEKMVIIMDDEDEELFEDYGESIRDIRILCDKVFSIYYDYIEALTKSNKEKQRVLIQMLEDVKTDVYSNVLGTMLV